MNNSFLLIFYFSFISLAQGQTPSKTEPIVITTTNKSTQVTTSDSGRLVVYVSPKDVRKFKAQGLVYYNDFGASGNGKTDDINAIAATHTYANQNGLKVKADDGATYYIGGKERTVSIQTDTDFGTAAFIIDDTKVQNRRASIFRVSSKKKSFTPKGISSLKRNQEKIDISLAEPSLIKVTNATIKRYIRYGLNQNNGSEQTDIFLVDQTGTVAVNTPIIWNFDQITAVTAIPIDKSTLKITGGRFTTIANKAESKYTYYSRNIAINRSNVLVDGLEHHVIGEGSQGAPYSGFINIYDCANITVRNSTLTGHKTYKTIGSAGKPVSMGSYDISVSRALNVSFINCNQTNDIKDKTYWGIMSSNYSKNLVYDNCTFSRFDAHMGVANATIRNSTLGHMGINAIGSGVLTVENTTIYSRNLINLRQDYGSTWQGKIFIRNCVFTPSGNRSTTINLIGGFNSGMHNFGYTCYLPEQITIENLHINDANQLENYLGPTIYNNFNPKIIDYSFQETFPYIRTKEIILKNVTTESGKDLKVSPNPYLFQHLNVYKD